MVAPAHVDPADEDPAAQDPAAHDPADDTAADGETRPPIEAVGSGVELRRWYWLKAELLELARARGVRTAGVKLELTDRLAAHLDGAPAPPPRTPRAAAPTRRGGARGTRVNRDTSRAAQLAGPLTRETEIPGGQRSSQALRAFFEAELGPGFRFDGAMRSFIADGPAGRTLGDAVDHWHATRERPRGEIAPQFELNRFVRAWHEANPGGTRAQALDAWRRHRALPVDRRP